MTAAAITADAQPPVTPPTHVLPIDAPKIGLALSGGGAKGFAHIGVLRALEEAGVQIDVITGTSMGALIGALYAIGYTPAQLERIAEEQDWEALFTDAPQRDALIIETKLADRSYPLEFPIRHGLPRLPRGLVRGQRIEQLVTQLTWSAHAERDFRRLPLPFAAVATDVETGAAVRLDRGVLPRALRASFAIPSVFTPAELDGRVLIDGGVARNLPAEDARALGADVLICVDVSEPLQPPDSLRTFLDIVDQTISFRGQASTREQRRRCDVIVQPDISGFSFLSFELADMWIERGAAAARQALPQIRARVPGSDRPAVRRADPTPPDSILVSGIEVEGLRIASRQFVRGILDLDPPAWVTPDEVDRAIARLYSTELFGLVTYRIESDAEAGLVGRRLVVQVEEEARDRLAVAYRYDSKYKASLLLSAKVHNLLWFGTVTRVDLRVGEQLRMVAESWRRTGPGRALHLELRGEFSRSPFEIFEDDRRIAEVDADVFQLSAFAGLALLDAALAGVRIKGEHTSGRARVAPEELEDKTTFYTLAGILEAETLDRDFFPTRGLSLYAKAEWADESFGGGETFSHYVTDAQLFVPVHANVSLLAGATAGTASGSDLPSHYLFFLGGANPFYIFPDRHFTFPGLETQERRGRHVQAFRLGAQVELGDHLLAQAIWNSGETFEEWEVDFHSYINGYALVLGVRTVFGNAWVTIAETRLDEVPDLTLDLGFRF